MFLISPSAKFKSFGRRALTLPYRGNSDRDPYKVLAERLRYSIKIIPKWELNSGLLYLTAKCLTTDAGRNKSELLLKQSDQASTVAKQLSRSNRWSNPITE